MSSWVMWLGSQPMIFARCLLPNSNSSFFSLMKASCFWALSKYCFIALEIFSMRPLGVKEVDCGGSLTILGSSIVVPPVLIVEAHLERGGLVRIATKNDHRRPERGSMVAT